MTTKKEVLNHRMMSGADIYSEHSLTYELFSRAEDFPNFVGEYLKERLSNKVVLDIGCGTGKYLNLLAPITNEYLGLDCSQEQLMVASKKAIFYMGRATHKPFPNSLGKICPVVVVESILIHL